MYSETIKPKVEEMFGELRAKAADIISCGSRSMPDAAEYIIGLVGDKTAERSLPMLVTMLYELKESLFKTSFFAEASRRNKFSEFDLQGEIIKKHQYSADAVIDYKEIRRLSHALKVAGGAAVAVGVGGVVVTRGRSIPIIALVIISLFAALLDYFVVVPKLNKYRFKEAVNRCLDKAQLKFLNWFDKIERDYNKRVDEIKATIGGE
jgi:hypothetical protein